MTLAKISNRALPARPWQERAGFEGRAGALCKPGNARLSLPFPETLPARGSGSSAPGLREARTPPTMATRDAGAAGTRLASPALDKVTSNVSGHPEARERQRLQHKLRRAAGDLLGGRVAHCYQHAAGFFVGLHQKAGQAHLSGVRTCGRVWTCAHCASRISEGRRLEIETILAKHHETGGKACMATLTIPHHRFDKLPALLKAVSTAWRYTKQGRGWIETRGNSGWIGDVRALEVTHGDNGWHPHLHVLILFKTGARSAAIEAFSSWLFDAWQRSIERLTGKRCTEKAFAWETVDAITGAAKYLAKWGPSLELTKANTKQGKRGGRTPMQILRDYVAHGVVTDGELFSEFAKAFRGVRQLTWARGLRARYLPKPEATDEELAQTETAPDENAAPKVATMSARLFRQISLRAAETELKIVLGAGGLPAVCDLLSKMEIPWRCAMPPPGDQSGAIPLLWLAREAPGDTARGVSRAPFPTRENKGFSPRGEFSENGVEK